MELDQLFTIANIVFCLIIWALVWAQRKVTRMAWKNAEDNKYYRGLFLPISPLAVGGVLAGLVSSYPFPEDFQSFWARVFFGIVCGLISAHVYKIVKKLIQAKSDAAGKGEGVDLLPKK